MGLLYNTLKSERKIFLIHDRVNADMHSASLPAPILNDRSREWSALFPTANTRVLVTGTDRDNNDVAVAHTVALMGMHVESSLASKQIKDAHDEIADQVGPDASEWEVLEAVHRWVKDRVTFVEDDATLRRLFGHGESTELLIEPPRLLSMPHPMGDCDDFSMLVAALLRSFGIRTDFATVAASSNDPSVFSHVYVVATLADGTQVPVDASHGKTVDWESPRQYRKQIWPYLGNVGEGNKDMIEGLGASGDWGGETNSPDTFPGGNNGSGFNWGGLIDTLTKTGTSILSSRYSTPQLDSGMYIRRADGSVVARDAGVPLGSGSAIGGMGSLLLIGGLAIVAFMVIGGRK